MGSPSGLRFLRQTRDPAAPPDGALHAVNAYISGLGAARDRPGGSILVTLLASNLATASHAASKAAAAPRPGAPPPEKHPPDGEPPFESHAASLGASRDAPARSSASAQIAIHKTHAMEPPWKVSRAGGNDEVAAATAAKRSRDSEQFFSAAPAVKPAAAAAVSPGGSEDDAVLLDDADADPWGLGRENATCDVSIE
jgi:hypothetical protein